MNLRSMVHLFELMSGLKVDLAKTTLLGINIQEEEVRSMSDLWGCAVGDWPLNYLGLSLAGNPKSGLFWDPIEEKNCSRLSKQKNFLGSRGGRLSLTTSVLANMPLYCFFVFLCPKFIIRKLEKLLRDFLWKGNERDNGSNLVNWKATSLPVSKGGLGVGNLEVKNLSLLAKWGWDT